MVKPTPLKDDLAKLARSRILDVASELFHCKGYAQTKMSDISDKLGVRKPYIYQHFGGKTEILVAVSSRTTAFAADMAGRLARQEGSASERLRVLVHDLAISVIESRTYLEVLFREEKHLPEEARRALGESRRAFNGSLRALLGQGVESGEFRVQDLGVAAEAITGMCTWLFSWYRSDGRLPSDVVATQMVELTLGLVRARDSRPEILTRDPA